jgi:hypothetical protein
VLRIVLFSSVEMSLGSLLSSEIALPLSLLVHTDTLISQHIFVIIALDDK